MGLISSLGEVCVIEKISKDYGSLEKHQSSVNWGMMLLLLLFTGRCFVGTMMKLRSGSLGGGKILTDLVEKGKSVSARRIDGAKVKVRATNGQSCPG